MAKSKNSPDGMEEENKVFFAFFKVGQYYRYGLLDADYNFIIEPIFHNVSYFANGLAAVEIKSNQWGYINTKGEWVIEPKFDYAKAFSEGLAAVKIDGKYGYINTEGELVIELVCKQKIRTHEFFHNGVAEVWVGSKWGIINTKGEWVVEPKFNCISSTEFSEGLLGVVIKEKYGYINTKGEYVVEPKFDCAGAFSDGLAVVRIDDKYGYINTKGEYVVEPKFDYAGAFSEGLAAVKIDGKEGYINTKGEWVIKPKFDNAFIFEDGIARVIIGDIMGYINTKGKWVIKPYAKKKATRVKIPKESKVLEEKTKKETSNIEVPEEYKGLPIIEIKTKEININSKSAKGFTEYPIVGGVFVGGDDDDVEAQAIVAYTLKNFREDADYIIKKFKSDFTDEVPVRVEASTKITGYGQAEDVEEMGDVIGCALNAYYGYYSGLGAYYWPDWFAKKAIFIVNEDKFTVDKNACLEMIDLSDEQLKALKAAL